MYKAAHGLSVLAFAGIFALVISRGAVAQTCKKVAAEYQQGVVSLTVKKTKKLTGEIDIGNGTGFIVSPQGYLITADHLVYKDSAVYDEVTIDGAIGSLYAAKSQLKVIEEDRVADVAILRFLDSSHLYKPVRLGNPQKMQIGDPLCSLGFSAPLNLDYAAISGSLSALSGSDDANDVRTLWTTQMPSNLGESGSPVMAVPKGAKGGVVAIKYGGQKATIAQNVNYIIPINLATPLIKKYTGSNLLLADFAAEPELHLSKMTIDRQVIPLGGWRAFSIQVTDVQGNPVKGAKVAWQTPNGGLLTYVAETDEAGLATATNLYTFGSAGTYVQTVKIVGKDTLIGFIAADKAVPAGAGAAFTFQQR